MSEVKLVWQRFIRLHESKLVGGDIEHKETPEGAYRGPITGIRVEGDNLVITTAWTAHMPTDARGMPIGNWSVVRRPGATRFAYDLIEIPGEGSITSKPQDIGGGRVHFTYPFSVVTLFPKGGSKLDSSRVKGL